MHLEVFSERESHLHAIAPTTRLLAFLPFAVVTAIIHEHGVLALALLAALVLAAAGRLLGRELALRMAAVNAFVLLLWLVLPFTTPGEPLFHLGALAASAQGCSFSLEITLKANALVLATIALLGTAPVHRLARSLQRLGCPAKLVLLFLFCYRYISVLHEDYEALLRGMKARGFKLETSLRCYRGMANLVAMLLVKSYAHSQEIYRAMLCRGFRGRYPSLSDGRGAARRDYVFLVGLLLFSASLAYLARIAP